MLLVLSAMKNSQFSSLYSLNLLSRKTLSTSPSSSSVALFWDLKSKPPTSTYRHLSPYDAAVRLRLAAASFGHLLSPSLAFSPSHRKSRSPPLQPPFPCRLCGRSFPSHQTLTHHFTSVHSPEHQRRLHRLDSATGRRRSILYGQLSLNLSRYEKAHKELFGCCEDFTDEVRRAGFRVLQGVDKTVYVCNELEKQWVNCAIIASDDLEFVRVLGEMRQRSVKSVVIGELKGDNGIKRHADVGFCWREVLAGKVKEEGPKVVARWREKELLERLEWRYDPSRDVTEEVSTCVNGEEEEKGKPWWKLDYNFSNQILSHPFPSIDLKPNVETVGIGSSVESSTIDRACHFACAAQEQFLRRYKPDAGVADTKFPWIAAIAADLKIPCLLPCAPVVPRCQMM